MLHHTVEIETQYHTANVVQKFEVIQLPIRRHFGFLRQP